MEDYYSILGISCNAVEADIKKAYRKMARTFHPDVNNAKDAAVRFREIHEAYKTLIDLELRAVYDHCFFKIPYHEEESYTVDDNIPYSAGVKGTSDRTYNYSYPTGSEDGSNDFSYVRFILWLLLAALIHWCTNQIT